jgi:hypothetical protein
MYIICEFMDIYQSINIKYLPHGFFLSFLLLSKQGKFFCTISNNQFFF